MSDVRPAVPAPRLTSGTRDSRIISNQPVPAFMSDDSERTPAMASLRAPTPLVRPMPVTIAVVLSALLIIGGFASLALPPSSGAEKLPTFVNIIIVAILSIVGIAAAVGLWQLRRWGFVSTVILTALDLLSLLVGIAVRPSIGIKILESVGVLVCAAILVLVTRPEARRAYQ